MLRALPTLCWLGEDCHTGATMNRLHDILCRSGIWRRTLEREIFPWVLEDALLGDEVLEIGPGPGLTTDLLLFRVKKLTAVEIDARFAASLARRLAGTNVTVLQQDSTALQIPDASFDGAICLTMLHHVPSPALQDTLLHEVARVLRPGSLFIGCDLLFRSRFDLMHLFDTKVPVDPQGFPARLGSAGFSDIHIDTRRHAFRFHARRI
jgi:SAM-dependent methyltransferase